MELRGEIEKEEEDKKVSKGYKPRHTQTLGDKKKMRKKTTTTKNLDANTGKHWYGRGDN